jgi:hypothetical protein
MFYTNRVHAFRSPIYTTGPSTRDFFEIQDLIKQERYFTCNEIGFGLICYLGIEVNSASIFIN